MTAQPSTFQSLSIGRRFYALWKFSRPHTIIGTTCSTLSLFLLSGSQNPSLFFWAWIACLCGNVYIVGLNQLTDVAIDRINKPHLPLASGEFSRAQGKGIVGGTGIAAMAIALFALPQSPWLLATVATSLAIGTAYSLPPFRLKRFPFWASVCIFTVRGVIVNLGLFWHFAGKFALPPSLVALTLFVLVFTFAIAIFKDIPDMEGDRQYNISTFTLRLGAKRIFNLARWVITACYGGLAIAAATVLAPSHLLPFLLSQLIPLSLFWILSQRVNLQQRRSITLFYQFIWVLFFAQYLLYPLTFF
jgi:homogentisate phytyltransferase / homogentisate geranylgeranyltransferase